MKTKANAAAEFQRWIDSGRIGNLIVYHPPGSDMCDFIEEVVIKVREMPPDVAASFLTFMDALNIERGEVFRDKDGRPDRVKLTRRFV